MIIKGINCESLFIDDASFYDGSVWTPIKIAPNAADQYLWKLAKGIAREKALIKHLNQRLPSVTSSWKNARLNKRLQNAEQRLQVLQVELALIFK